MWQTIPSEEAEASAPAVQAHFHALRTENALKKEDFVAAEREARLASEKFLLAAETIADKRTIDALSLLADHYERRANEARAKNPNAASEDAKASEKETTPPPAPLATLENPMTPKDLPKASRQAMDKPRSSLDPKAGIAVETQLNVAAAEMEELWKRLNEIGLSGGNNSEKANLLMASRHLSSSLGDSFCLLPTKARTSVGVHATAIDGVSTLRAAVASRMRNQRVRLMEKQYGPRVPMDDRSHKQRSASIPTNHRAFSEGTDQMKRESSSTESARRDSLSGRGSDAAELQRLQETISHQKYEIVRLLNAVKTLSTENTTLLKKCDTLTNVQEENKEIRQSMESFKTHYNQKLVVIKRALEEWRRQQRSQGDRGIQSSSASDNASSANTLLEQQIAQLIESGKQKDIQLAKYEKWYQTLKAGAKAKQRSQMQGSQAGSLVDGGASASGMVVRDSFTNSSSFHDYNVDRMAVNNNTNRPPAHPNRRAL